MEYDQIGGYLHCPIDLQCHNFFSEGHPRRNHTAFNGGRMNLVDFGDGEKVPACWICGKRLALTDVVSEVEIIP